MADFYWIGSDGDWNDPNNWSLGDVPGDDDSVFFTSLSQVSVTDSPQYEFAFALVYVAPEYTGSLGTNNDPITNFVAETLIFRGSGQMHFYPKCTGGGSTNIVVNSPNKINAFTLYGYSVSNSVGRFGIARGAVTITGTHPSISALYVYHLGSRETDAIVDIAANANSLSQVFQSGGIIQSTQTVSTRLQLTGGQYIHSGGGELGSIISISGGTLYYNGSTNINGDLILFDGGTCDLRQNVNRITLAQVIKLGKASRFYRNGYLHTVTAFFDHDGDGVDGVD